MPPLVSAPSPQAAAAVQHLGSGGPPSLLSFRGVLLAAASNPEATHDAVPVGVPCDWRQQLVNITARTPYDTGCGAMLLAPRVAGIYPRCSQWRERGGVRWPFSSSPTPERRGTSKPFGAAPTFVSKKTRNAYCVELYEPKGRLMVNCRNEAHLPQSPNPGRPEIAAAAFLFFQTT